MSESIDPVMTAEEAVSRLNKIGESVAYLTFSLGVIGDYALSKTDETVSMLGISALLDMVHGRTREVVDAIAYVGNASMLAAQYTDMAEDRSSFLAVAAFLEELHEKILKLAVDIEEAASYAASGLHGPGPELAGLVERLGAIAAGAQEISDFLGSCR